MFGLSLRADGLIAVLPKLVRGLLRVDAMALSADLPMISADPKGGVFLPMVCGLVIGDA